MLYSILVPKMTVFLNKDIARDCSSEPFNLGWVNENTISLGDCHLRVRPCLFDDDEVGYGSGRASCYRTNSFVERIGGGKSPATF